MSKENGGSAFPQPIANAGKGAGLVSADEMFVGGMTLRDYFAAKAMQGWLATFSDSRHPAENGGLSAVAKSSYAIADAMLAERSKP